MGVCNWISGYGNWWALCRALVQNIQAGHVVSGGSTLSMQVVRLALGNPPRTVPEKIREIFLTLRMEQDLARAVWQRYITGCSALRIRA